MAEAKARELDPAQIQERRVITMTALASTVARGITPSRQPQMPGYVAVDDADEDLLDIAARLHVMLGYDFDGDPVSFLANALNCIITAVQTNDDLKVDADVKGKVSAVNSYEVDYRIVVTAPYKTKTLKVWLPLPQTDKAQKITNVKLNTFPQVVEPQINLEKKFGNKFAYFEFKNPKGAQIITFQFVAQVGDVHWNMDLAKVQKVSKWPKGFKPFLRSEFDEKTRKQFESVPANALPNKNDNGLDVQAIIQWTDENLTYSHSNASLKADAGHALEQRQGHCSDYHGLCSACRVLSARP